MHEKEQYIFDIIADVHSQIEINKAQYEKYKDSISLSKLEKMKDNNLVVRNLTLNIYQTLKNTEELHY